MTRTAGDVYRTYGTRFSLELAAGADGLSRELKWVYVAEDYTTSDFLRGGELIITTGVISGGSADWLLRFLRHMVYQKTCGLILNLGPYLKQSVLTEEVISFCDEHRYPLFVMPWQIHIYDVTRVLYEQIYLRTRRDEAVRDAVRRLLSDPRADEDAADTLRRSGFSPAERWLTAAVRGADEQILLSLGLRGGTAPGDGCCLLAVCGTDADTLLQRLREALPEAVIGLGDEADGPGGLYHSARHARAALALGLRNGQPVTRFDECGLYRLLADIPDLAALRRYADSCLAPLHEYDRLHGGNLARTLYLYLLHDGSIQKTAEESFCHRNTVNYRLRLLREELGFRLDDPGTRFTLLTAFYGEIYLAAIEENEQISQSNQLVLCGK